jgi:hypothetical protein
MRKHAGSLKRWKSPCDTGPVLKPSVCLTGVEAVHIAAICGASAARLFWLGGHCV